VEARVAILWDVESFWAHDLEWRPSVELQHRERVVAWYSALWHLGVTVDFRHPHDDLSGYDLVLAPSLYLADRHTTDALGAFVRGGGTFVASYFSGVVDENDTVHAGGAPGALREVLGLSVPEFLPLYADQVVTLDDGTTGTGWSDDIVLEGAVAIASYVDGPAAGGPAVTRHTHGDGSAWYVSTRTTGADLEGLVRSVLDDAGVPLPVEHPDGLEVVVRHGDDADFTFLVNHAGAATDVEVGRGTELITGDAVDGRVVVPAGAVRVVSRPRG